MLVRPQAFDGHRELLGRLVSGDGLAELARELGVGSRLRLPGRRIGLEDLVRKLGEVLGAPCVAVILPHPELALRVRGRLEHHTARARLEER
jgi:hypothetical protein